MFTDTVDTWTGYSDAEFDTRLRELELQRRTLDAAMAAAIAVGDARQINQIDGHCTMKGYLRATPTGPMPRLPAGAVWPAP